MNKRRNFLYAILFFILIFSATFWVLAQTSLNLLVTDRDSFVSDVNGNGLADTGDVIQYTVIIANCGAETAQSVHYNSQIDINTQLNPNTITESNLQDASGVCGAGNANPPVDPGPPPAVNAVAVNDAIPVTNGGNIITSITTNDRGDAPIQVISFGDSVPNVGTIPADGATIGSFPAGGGTIDVVIAADGMIDMTAVGTTGTGTVTIFYEIQVGNGTTDIGQIDITFGDFPTAIDDTLGTLGAGSEYDTDVNVTLNVGAGAGLLNNDTLGNPAATLTLWGGGDASPTVNSAPGTSRPLAGGTLTVNADGSFDLVNPTVPGTYTFDYIIDNGLGTSQATVEIYVNDPPVAQDDAFNASVGQTNNYVAPALFDDNGSGTDYLGAPPATITFFGGGAVSALVTDNAVGATIAIPVLGGTLTVNADGSFVVDAPTMTGSFTFEYLIDNGVGTSIGTVTINVVATPVTQNDLLTLTLPANLAGDLTANNGSGADDPGIPAFTSLTFGAGDLGGAVTDNAGGSSVALAGGTLTVNNDGTVTLNGVTDPGVYTFDYQLTNANGTSNISTVTIEVYALPDAIDDGSALTAGYTTNTGVTLMTSVATGVLQNNDDYTLPNVFDDATVTRYADVGDIGGGSTILVGNPYTIPASGGITIIIAANGALTIDASAIAAIPGDYSFDYEIANSVGVDVATVFISISQGVLALDDNYTFLFSANQNVVAGAGLFANNGSGVDILGSPTGALTSFGAGSLGGAVTDNAASASVALAGGTMTVNADGSWSLTGQPFTPGTYTFDYELTNAINSATATVTLVIQDPPTALADAVTATVNLVNNFVGPFLFSDNGSGVDLLGTPAATLSSFGGGSLGGAVTDNAAGATVALAGGTLTVNADGSFAVNSPTTSGTFTFDYRLTNASGTSDATVTVTIQATPLAQNDSYTFLFSVNQNVAAGTGLFVDNGSGVDSLGNPVATLTSFGGGSLGGTVITNAAGASVALAGGTLTVNADGSWSLTGQPFTPGTYTFDYRLTNVSGTSDATVTLVIQDPPTAQADALTATISIVNNYGASTIFNNNGSGADSLGTPAATLTSFGGGNAPGTVVTNAAGATVAFAGGTLTVNGNGSLDITNPTSSGIFTFDYRLTNASGTSDATVTVTIQAPPLAQNDAYSFLPTANQNIAAGAGLFVDNGSGVDSLGFPNATLTSFGGGSLGGTVVTNAAGATVALAGGNLTVNTDGSWSLTGQPFTPGIYTFVYRLTNVAGTFDATVTLTISDPAVCAVDAYTATGNISISTLNGVNQSVIFNDTGGGITVTGIDGTANIGIAEATTNGSITIQALGEFTYTPNTGFTGVDSIAYEITSGFGTVTTLNCTINITVSNLIYFMDSTAAAGTNDGSFASPYRSPADHNAAPPSNNSFLFIEDNGADYTGPLTLVSGEYVIGEGTSPAAQLFGSITGITLAPLSVTVPYNTTGNAGAWVGFTSAGSGIVLNTVNTLSGIDIGNTTGYGIIDSGATVGTLTITESRIIGTGGIVSITNGGTLNVTFTTVSTSSVADEAIILAGVGGTGFVVQNNTSITQTGGTSPAISISNSTTTLIDISDGATLTITSRRDSGIELNTVSGTTNFGTSTVSNGNNETEPAVSLITVSGAVDFDSLTIDQSNDGAGESFTGSFPNDNSGAGDAVYGNGATGGLTVNAGAISNVSDDGFDWRNSGVLTLTNVTINHQHGTTGTAGIQAYNSQGVAMTGGSITNFASAAVGGQRPLGVNILHDLNYTTATGTFTFNSVDFDGNAGASAGTALGGGIAQYLEDNASITVNVTNGSTFADVFAKAIITQNSSGSNLSATGGTVTTTVTGSSFNAPLTGGQSSIEVASGGAGMTGNVAFNINNNTFTNFGSSQGTAILINLNQAGNARTQMNTINGNTITETTTPGVSGIGIVIDETSGLRLQASTNTVSGVSGAALSITGLTTWTSGVVDISMANSTFSSTTTFSAITIVEDGGAGTTMELLWNNVDSNAPNSTLDGVEVYVRNGGRLDLVSTNGDFTSNGVGALDDFYVQAGTGTPTAGTVCLDFNDDGGGANTTPGFGFYLNELGTGNLLVENGTTVASIITDNPGMTGIISGTATVATCNDAAP